MRRWLSAGRYAPGSLLPSERDLADRLGLARGTVRQALADLEAEGRLQRSAGRGWVVAAVAARPTTLVLVSAFDVTNASGQGMVTGWENFIQVGILREAANAGLDSLLLRPARVMAEGISALTASRPAGVVFLDAGSAAAEWGAQLLATGIPVAAHEYDAVDPCDRVVADQAAGCELLTVWLLGQGRRRILRCWCSVPPGYPAWLRLRDAGYERAMRAAGLAPLPALVPAPGEQPPGDSAFALRVRVAAGWLAPHVLGPEPVDAILVASDGIVATIAAACRELGRPELPVAGYDNYWMDIDPAWYDGVPCLPVASVDKQNARIGAELVRLLTDRAAGRLAAGPVVRLVPPRLVIPPAH